MYENGSFVKIQKRELQLKVTPIIMLANSVEEQNYRAKSQQIYTLKKKLYKRKITKKNLLYHLIQSVQSIGFISSQLIIRFAYQNCKFKK